VSSYPFTHHI